MPFNSLAQYVARADDILVVRCVRRQDDETARSIGFYTYQVELRKNLKAVETRKKLWVHAILNQMIPGRRYLVFCFGTVHSEEPMRIDNGQISPVPIPQSFGLDQLKDKAVEQQVRTVLAARRAEIDRLISKLRDEAKLIDKGLGLSLGHDRPDRPPTFSP